MKLFLVDQGELKEISKSIFSSGDVYLLDAEKTIYVWIGNKCSVDEKTAGAAQARTLDQQRGGAAKIITVDQGFETKEFLSLISSMGAMKIVEKNLRQSFVKVVPSSDDDLWHLYNIIYKGDEVYAYSSRAIKSDKEYSRPKSGERVSAFIGVKVESVSWDKFLGKLRVHGLIIHAPEIIPTGAHHTLNIALNQPATIVKKEFPKHLLDRLTRASKTEKPMIILAIDDEGFAIAETRQYGVDIKVEERMKMPGKHEADKRSAATKDYFKLIR